MVHDTPEVPFENLLSKRSLLGQNLENFFSIFFQYHFFKMHYAGFHFLFINFFT